MDKPKVQTVLQNFAPVSGEHKLSEAKLCGKINLRGDANNDAFKQAIKTTLGVALPEQANTVSVADEKSIFWLGPDEWLAHVPLEALAELMPDLSKALADQHAAMTDVSDYFTIIEHSGPSARAVLANASPFDTRPHNFAPGQCAQTRFGHASILLWPTDGESTYRIQVRWSYAQYMFEYLAESIANIENLAAFQQGQ